MYGFNYYISIIVYCKYGSIISEYIKFFWGYKFWKVIDIKRE